MKKMLLIISFFLFTHPFLVLDLHGQSDALVDIKYAAAVIHVGGSDANIQGFSSGAIQIALDALKTRGGGTVELGQGVYDITAPLRMPDNTTLSGSGKGTVLRKVDGIKTRFIVDADWGMRKVTLKDINGFRVGMAIYITDDDNKRGWAVTTARITDIVGNVIYFDNRTVRDYMASLNGTVSTASSVIEAVGAKNVVIKDLVVDGNKHNNDPIAGNRGGGVYIFQSKNCLIENVTVKDFNGDSFSWQITEDITLKGCEASGGEGLGFHPGTGSEFSIIEDCRSHHNKLDGIFLCWRVRDGIFRNNEIYSNGRYGISIGHQDTDNLFEKNHIYENALHGVYFRDEPEPNAGHRNRFTGNIIENNGGLEQSCGFYISGVTKDIDISGNTIRSTGKGDQRTGIFIGKNASQISVTDNQFYGCREEVVFERDR